MSISEEELIALVPVQSGIWFTDCPNRDAATQDSGNWSWTPRDPGRMTCRDCGEVYPGNSKYRETGQIEVDSPGGNHVYPYWKASRRQVPDIFPGPCRLAGCEYMDTACRDLAHLYDATQDENHARRAALILIRFAQVYPGYAMHFDYPFQAKVFWPYNATEFHHPTVRRAPDRLAKYDWWRYMDVGEDLVQAYDVLRHWPRLKEMADGRAVTLIEDDLLGAMVNFALGYPDPLSNMGPTNWRRVIGAGRVLQRPEYVHEAVARFERFLTTQFLDDGHWQETSPSYNSQCISGISVIRRALRDYVDPPGYQHPGTGKRLDGQAMERLFARYDRSLQTVVRPRLPDGRLLPVNDTWWTSAEAPRQSMQSDLLPGLGAVVLGGGAGDRQLHVHLNFSSGRGHKHRDALSLGLFAASQRAAPRPGLHAYRLARLQHLHHEPQHRRGQRCRAGLRSGLVRQPTAGFRHGRPSLPRRRSRERFGVSRLAARSSHRHGHRPGRDRIARCGRVPGHRRNQHDYLLHGSADDDSTARVTGVEMVAFGGSLMNAGIQFREPRGENDDVGEAGAVRICAQHHSGAHRRHDHARHAPRGQPEFGHAHVAGCRREYRRLPRRGALHSPCSQDGS